MQLINDDGEKLYEFILACGCMNAEKACVGKAPMKCIDRIAEATLFAHFLKQAGGHATAEDH